MNPEKSFDIESIGAVKDDDGTETTQLNLIAKNMTAEELHLFLEDLKQKLAEKGIPVTIQEITQIESSDLIEIGTEKSNHEEGSVSHANNSLGRTNTI